MYFLAAEYLVYQLQTNNKLLEWVKWFATFCVCASAILVSFSIELSLQPHVFLGFLIAHILWTGAGIIMKDKPIIVLNAIFILIDTYAIIIRL